MEIVLYPDADAIPAADWAALDSAADPFASQAFLGTAERVGASGTAMAWQARHLALQSDGVMIGLLPMYLRGHSFGDFSRDWNWPSAWQRAGLAYYPKLVSGIPYTPSPGPRLLVRTGLDRQTVAPALIEAALEVTRRANASSWQCLFVEDNDRAALADAGLLMRRGVQFHWFNHGYGDFDDFLVGFTSAKRKKLKRERRAVAESGLRLEVRHGDEIDAELWESIHRQYRDTFFRYGNHPAFPAEFFPQVAERLGGNSWSFSPGAATPRWPRPSATAMRQRCTAATGARKSTSPACTSSFVTTRASTTASATNSRVSSPEHRANISWRAASNRCRPGPRSGLPIPECAAQ
jgi:hypothetical protein